MAQQGRKADLAHLLALCEQEEAGEMPATLHLTPVDYALMIAEVAEDNDLERDDIDFVMHCGRLIRVKVVQ